MPHIAAGAAQGDGVQNVPFAHQVADQRLSCRLLKGLNRAGQKAGDVDVPDLNMTGEYERGQNDIENGVGQLSDDKLELAPVAVGQHAGDDAKEEKRDSPHRVDKSQLQRRMCEAVDQPAARGLVHPRAQSCAQLGQPQPAEIRKS
jgi:hypothetical protein